MNVHEKLNYVEFPASDLNATKIFFEKVFAWTFLDYGPEYTAFTGEGLDGGFFQSPLSSTTESGGALLVFYSQNLESTLAKVKQEQGQITKSLFSFTGGTRFHFKAPSGNEFEVWAELGGIDS